VKNNHFSFIRHETSIPVPLKWQVLVVHTKTKHFQVSVPVLQLLLWNVNFFFHYCNNKFASHLIRTANGRGAYSAVTLAQPLVYSPCKRSTVLFQPRHWSHSQAATNYTDVP